MRKLTRNEAQALKQFPKDVDGHVMSEEVFVSGTNFRSIYFGKPGTGMYHFRLITWPGCLTIEGDMGCFTFTRIADMFNFFRGTGSIDHRYWAEKCIGSPKEFRGDGVEEYSVELARKHVEDAIDERFADKPPKGGKGSSRDEWEGWVEDLGLDTFTKKEESAFGSTMTTYVEIPRKGLIELAEAKEKEIRDEYRWELLAYVDEEHFFYTKLRDMDNQHGIYLGTDDFPQFTDYTYRFYWVCEAIRWGIAQWDAQQAAIASAEAQKARIYTPGGSPVGTYVGTYEAVKPSDRDTKTNTEEQAADFERARMHAPDFDERPSPSDLSPEDYA